MESSTNELTASDSIGSAAETPHSTNKHAYTNGPRTITGLSRWAVFGLSAFMIAELAFVLISVLLIWLYLPTTIVPFSQAQLEMIDYFIIGVAVIQTVLFWFCVVLVGRVTFRAMKNLYTVGSKFPEMSPGWAVGWYFIPIANLWQPAKGMSQIYHGTYHAVGEATPSESRIAVWWTCWLITNFAANIALRIGGFDSAGTGVVTFSFDAISSLFGMASAWALIRLIKPIAEKQELLKHGGVAHVFD